MPKRYQLEQLSRSRFRMQFRLDESDLKYLRLNGLNTVIDHGRKFLRERLAPAVPRNDGRQTPMRGHPVFIAQHATATCCRKCLARWHGIPRGRQIDDAEIEAMLDLISSWLRKQAPEMPESGFQPGLFP